MCSHQLSNDHQARSCSGTGLDFLAVGAEAMAEAAHVATARAEAIAVQRKRASDLAEEQQRRAQAGGTLLDLPALCGSGRHLSNCLLPFSSNLGTLRTCAGFEMEENNSGNWMPAST